ncbi:LEAF RUST 10 DISEASE-RESISTANCE LOCUS RECEPTOR-LIKE PROTEIN KINASE-like 1.4 isoform X2 [Salvia miltiorrhiza]|uniref:LEAF RUST 10 DISEASE-RESISTANCE LOCUS RECEPTOR-LIKE PROTEIN KINASE-like 1.4 isoform X2 n=1 Tax=Salvia miltiorrhiza TaxID=226208 RepID=UPI0025ACB94E|nr:LEAF RUST 10 DISEASE-RESISTANCE LOCUS RECEPTOR-LIKE PROTEIN KINASE-like 1.4 isoform X2 [Salvia miltiorrhiza]XP_057809427.1 LEAF RUST 10 DISEASE-RESISTANCE LOCUS RECEPTOR-LIKE PROTEIN KINASE-like 1.4 isoform X2 [Salvia miltiorrhiza]
MISWLSFLLILKFSIGSSDSGSELYRKCSNTFSCGGNITGIGYPFRGAGDPEYCGHRSLVLSCDERRNVTNIDIMDLRYRVLEMDGSSQTMRIAREDTMSSACPSVMANTTLDYSVFDYASSCMNYTFLYGCPFNPGFLMHVPCGGDAGGAYVLPGAAVGPKDCDASVIVSGALVAINEPLGTPELGEALKHGFQIRWKMESKSCSDCTASQGRCGYDLTTNKTVCYCRDPPYVSDACTVTDYRSPPKSKGSRNTERSIGLFIAGAILTGVGLGWLVFHCRQKRKQRLALMSSQITSKEITSSPSTKGLLSPPSSNYTKSILSYPSTKSDFGRRSSDFGVQVFNCTELEEATNKFDPSRELGDGGFGTVYYGVLSDGRVVAVKRLYENNFKRAEQFINEVEILTRLRHQYLVKLYGCTSRRSQELLLVYEYVANGTVADHLHGKRAKSGLLSWPIRLQIAVETADALAYLHRSDIIHRDVKTNNILLDNDFHVKVADFGLSRLFPNDVTHVSTAPQGTPGYVDPEYYQCYQLTEKSDVYSFGVVLIELISSLQAVDTNRHRHDINLSNMAVNKIQNRTLHELVDSSVGFHTNSSVRRMVTLVAELAFRCLQQEKDMRPSMQEVLDVLKGIQNEDSNALAVEIVDLSMAMGDDAGLLKGSTTPRSQDSLP